ncbi:Protein of uncharacterised function (DUF3592) [Legionella lansingensis]|uniref:DUF3592 domain-containing protein n=2 Tax=Legionella lansingensis TaxID=45067 RepID=A0A0W0VMA1_9GAMM|nr:hypothetical protein Llan_1664 [Legionella lansingensis]SNV44374.1 Protein of uncharacterised function (DUF3592) [Legionella lansingensis]
MMAWRWLLDLLWLSFLLILLYHFWRDRQRLKKTRFWFLTKGRITEFLWTREGYTLRPKIEYSYNVFDREYQGEHLFLDTAHNNPNSKHARQVAYRAAVAYEKDEDIDVYYNPSNPQEAVLDITIPSRLNFIIVLLIALVVVHLIVVISRLL